MAERNRLHQTHLAALKDWLERKGWRLEQPKGEYEVLRAVMEKKWLLIFERHRSDHLSYETRHARLIDQFLSDLKKIR